MTEEVSEQCLWVADANAIEPVQGWLQHIDFSDSVFDVESGSSYTIANDAHYSAITLMNVWSRFPITLSVIVLAFIGYASIELQWLKLLQFLTFQPLEFANNTLRLGSAIEAFKSFEIWRLVTPVFIHFSILHVVFNCLWVWEFGRRIEQHCGAVSYFNVLLIVGIFSNVSQYVWAGPSLFGGLSGVVYGVLGFVWMMYKRNPVGPLQVQPALFGFLLFWLVLGFTGFLNVFVEGSIANVAHASGLIGGLLLGAVWRLPQKHNDLSG